MLSGVAVHARVICTEKASTEKAWVVWRQRETEDEISVGDQVKMTGKVFGGGELGCMSEML